MKMTSLPLQTVSPPVPTTDDGTAAPPFGIPQDSSFTPLLDSGLLPQPNTCIANLRFATLSGYAYMDNMRAVDQMLPELVHDVCHVGSLWVGANGSYTSLSALRVVSSSDGQMKVRTEIIGPAHLRLCTLFEEQRPIKPQPTVTLVQSELENMVASLMTGEMYQPADGSVTNKVIGNVYSLFTGMGAASLTDNSNIRDTFDHSARELRDRHKMSPLSAFRWCVRNWKNLRDSPIFGHVSTILSIAIALGFAPEKWGHIELGSVQIFQLTTKEKYTDALTIVDGIMSATEYFVEAAVASWEVGNFLPFFLEKHMSSHLDNMYDELAETIPLVRDGSFRKAGGNWGEVMLKLQKCKKAFVAARDVSPARTMQRKILQDRVLQIQAWAFQLSSCIKAGDVVEQPYCNITFGPPRTGKTGFTQDLIKINSAVLGLDYSPEMVANITPGDEYHSQVGNHTVFLVYDDIASNKPQYDKALGVVGIIQSVNNMRFVAVKAEADQKGCVMPELGGVYGTTNIEHMNSHVFANTSAAVEQRYVLTKIRTRPKWALEGGGVDKHKVSAECNDYVEYGGVKYKDISLYDICMSYGSGHRVVTALHPLTGMRMSLSDLNVAEAYYWHEYLMLRHREEQQAHVERLRGTTFKCCPVCKKITCYCPPKVDFQGTGTAPPSTNNQPRPRPVILGIETPPPSTCSSPLLDERAMSDYSADLRDFDRAHPDPVCEFSDDFDTLMTNTTPLPKLHTGFKPLGAYGLKPIPETSDLGEEYQGVYSDAVTHGVHHAVSRYFSETPIVPGFFDITAKVATPWFWGQTAYNVTGELLKFSSNTPMANWWYWVPEWVWTCQFMPSVASYLQDDEIRLEIYKHYQRIKWFLPMMVIILVSIVCLVGLDPTNVYIILWFVVSAIYSLYWHLRTQRLRFQTFEILTAKRQLMGSLRDCQVAYMSEVYQLALKAVCAAAVGYVMYEGFSWAYKEFVTDEKRDPCAPDDMPAGVAVPPLHGSEVSAVTEVFTPDPPNCDPIPQDDLTDSIPERRIRKQVAPSKATKSLPPVPPSSQIYSFEEPPPIPKPVESYQGFMSVNTAELARKENNKEAWQYNWAEQRSLHKPINGMTHEQMVSKATRGLVSAYRQNETNNWFFSCNLFFYDTHLCITGIADRPKSVESWLLVAGQGPHDRCVLTVSPEDFYEVSPKLVIGKLNARSFANIRSYFNSNPTRLDADYYMRLEDASLRNRVPVTGRAYLTDPSEVPIIHWNFPVPTQKGMCGGVYITRGSKPSIVGVHYACRMENKLIGLSAVVTPEMFRAADVYFMSVGRLLPPSIDPDQIGVTINGKAQFTALSQPPVGGLPDQVEWLCNNDPNFPDLPGPLPQQRIDNTEHLPPSEITTNPTEEYQGDARSPDASEQYQGNDLDPDEDPQGAQYVGHRSSSAFFKSKAVDTLIADSIRKEFSDCPDFGRPHFGRGMWPKGAAYTFTGSPGVPREHLDWAIQDWLSVFMNNKIPDPVLKTLHPLTWEEVINGIDRIKFIDSMNLATSMGAGFAQGKRHWIYTYLNEDGIERKQFMDEVWDQVRLAFEAFSKGERVPFLFIATPKDEPTPITKEKVRLFMVGEISSLLIARKYFTPVVRLLQMLPSWSESCVGINATSPEWESLWKRFETFPHCFDGDHAKYDLVKASVVGEASYYCMIQLASLGEYTSKDLHIMNCLACEFLMPLVAYKQDVVLLQYSTPSGINTTVNSNGCDNSLLNRCAYYFLYPDAYVGEFRTYVKHGNYGDDFINSVSPERLRFNFINLQSYLAAFGLKITPGLKEAEGQPFVDELDDLVFLQRFSSHLPELPYRVGKLKETSILKSLICVMQGKGDWDLAVATVDNVDGALREWVYHGEDVYEARRALMDRILTDHNVRHLSRVIDTPYLELLNHLQLEWLC